MRKITCLLLCLLLSGCGQEEDNRIDVDLQRQEFNRELNERLTDALQREEEAERKQQHEQERREFWQALACTGAVVAVVLFVSGTALGSKARSDHEQRKHRT